MDPKWITEEYVSTCLPQRAPEAHKGDFGRILLLCGSVGYTGAASMAAQAAVRCGSGLTFVGVPDAIYPIVAGKLDVPMVFPLPSENGMLSSDGIRQILQKAKDMDAVLLGPGLGRSEGVRACVRAVIEQSRVPVVLDADGINTMSEHIDVLRDSACPLILTPHLGEFCRLGGRTDLPRELAAMELAETLGCICVLKGMNTVVTDGDTCFLNPTGNPGMAVGGSGDVLSGMIVSLLGQGLSPMDAACCSVFLHGRAGDLCAAEIGQYGMLPTDIIGILPRLLP